MLKFYLIIATRLKIFLQLVVRNGISLKPRTPFYFFFLLQSSVWSSLLVFREKVAVGRKIKKTPVPADPIFIIGHWRTGSTFLHQIFQCDPHFTTPTLMQCTYPESFISSRNSIYRIMNWFLPETRPMDNVKLGPDDPQEDEYALFRMTAISPLEKLIFPHSARYFLLDIDHYTLEGSQRSRWEQALFYFIKKLSFNTGRRIVFKNPFHSLRMDILQEIFPEARFIHIFRDPRIVIPSTLHMWTVVGNDNALRSDWKPPEFEEIITGFDIFMCHLYKHLSALPKENYLEVRFEDLEHDPVSTIKSIYAHFAIDYSEGFETSLNNFLHDNAAYKKNLYTITKEQEEMIYNRLHTYMTRGGYK